MSHGETSQFNTIDDITNQKDIDLNNFSGNEKEGIEENWAEILNNKKKLLRGELQHYNSYVRKANNHTIEGLITLKSDLDRSGNDELLQKVEAILAPYRDSNGNYSYPQPSPNLTQEGIQVLKAGYITILKQIRDSRLKTKNGTTQIYPNGVWSSSIESKKYYASDATEKYESDNFAHAATLAIQEIQGNSNIKIPQPTAIKQPVQYPPLQTKPKGYYKGPIDEQMSEYTNDALAPYASESTETAPENGSVENILAHLKTVPGASGNIQGWENLLNNPQSKGTAIQTLKERGWLPQEIDTQTESDTTNADSGGYYTDLIPKKELGGMTKLKFLDKAEQLYKEKNKKFNRNDLSSFVDNYAILKDEHKQVIDSIVNLLKQKSDANPQTLPVLTNAETMINNEESLPSQSDITTALKGNNPMETLQQFEGKLDDEDVQQTIKDAFYNYTSNGLFIFKKDVTFPNNNTIEIKLNHRNEKNKGTITVDLESRTMKFGNDIISNFSDSKLDGVRTALNKEEDRYQQEKKAKAAAKKAEAEAKEDKPEAQAAPAKPTEKTAAPAKPAAAAEEKPAAAEAELQEDDDNTGGGSQGSAASAASAI